MKIEIIKKKFQDSTTTTPGLCSLIKDSEKCYNNKKCHYDWNSSSCRDINIDFYNIKECPTADNKEKDESLEEDVSKFKM